MSFVVKCSRVEMAIGLIRLRLLRFAGNTSREHIKSPGGLMQVRARMNCRQIKHSSGWTHLLPLQLCLFYYNYSR